MRYQRINPLVHPDVQVSFLADSRKVAAAISGLIGLGRSAAVAYDESGTALPEHSVPEFWTTPYKETRGPYFGWKLWCEEIFPGEDVLADKAAIARAMETMAFLPANARDDYDAELASFTSRDERRTYALAKSCALRPAACGNIVVSAWLYAEEQLGTREAHRELYRMMETPPPDGQANHVWEPGRWGTCARCGTNPATAFTRDQHPFMATARVAAS